MWKRRESLALTVFDPFFLISVLIVEALTVRIAHFIIGDRRAAAVVRSANVIPFPETARGTDPMADASSTRPEKQLGRIGIAVLPPAKWTAYRRRTVLFAGFDTIRSTRPAAAFARASP